MQKARNEGHGRQIYEGYCRLCMDRGKVPLDWEDWFQRYGKYTQPVPPQRKKKRQRYRPKENRLRLIWVNPKLLS